MARSNAKGQDSDLLEFMEREETEMKAKTRSEVNDLLSDSPANVVEDDDDVDILKDDEEELVDDRGVDEEVTDESNIEEEDKEEDEGEESGVEESEHEEEQEEAPADPNMQALLDRINELEARLSERAEEREEQPAPEPIKFTVDSSEELDNLISSPEEFNKYIGNVVQAAREEVLRDLPDLAAKSVARQLALTNLVEGFYQKNPDLANVKDFVRMNFNQVVQEHPGWPVERQMEVAGERSRQRLGLAKEAAEVEGKRRKESTQNKTPAFAKTPTKGKRPRTEVDKRTPMQKDISNLIAGE